MVLNTVNTWGQDETARSDCRLCLLGVMGGPRNLRQHPRCGGPGPRRESGRPASSSPHTCSVRRKRMIRPRRRIFNTPAVLLADATIFASGASHIELGDGSRMLSSEYFPADTKFAVSPELSMQLRHYYDFLTAYENVLRYQVAAGGRHGHRSRTAIEPLRRARTRSGPSPAARAKKPSSTSSICRAPTIPHWRDVHADRPDAPAHQLKVRVAADSDIA